MGLPGSRWMACGHYLVGELRRCYTIKICAGEAASCKYMRILVAPLGLEPRTNGLGVHFTVGTP